MSSVLYESVRMSEEGRMKNVHLLAAVDEALLNRRDTFLLLDLFLDLRNLQRVSILVTHTNAAEKYLEV